MIKRTNSFEVEEKKSKRMSESGADIKQGNEDEEEERDKVPHSINVKEISGIKVSKQQSSNKEPSIGGTRRKIPSGIMASIKMNASGKKPEMGKSKFGKVMMSKFRETRDITFVCEICEM